MLIFQSYESTYTHKGGGGGEKERKGNIENYIFIILVRVLNLLTLEEVYRII